MRLDDAERAVGESGRQPETDGRQGRRWKHVLQILKLVMFISIVNSPCDNRLEGIMGYLNNDAHNSFKDRLRPRKFRIFYTIEIMNFSRMKNSLHVHPG